MMNSELELDKRISVLEKSMEWAQSSVQKIDKDLDIIKNTQYQLIEKMSDFKTETEQKFHEVNERFTLLHADMEIKISSFRSEILERMTQQQAHNDEKFMAVHERFTDVQKEIAGIHHAISVQTKWLLGVMIACATMISLLHPLAMTLLAK